MALTVELQELIDNWVNEEVPYRGYKCMQSTDNKNISVELYHQFICESFQYDNIVTSSFVTSDNTKIDCIRAQSSMNRIKMIIDGALSIVKDFDERMKPIREFDERMKPIRDLQERMKPIRDLQEISKQNSRSGLINSFMSLTAADPLHSYRILEINRHKEEMQRLKEDRQRVEDKMKREREEFINHCIEEITRYLDQQFSL